MVWWIKNKLLEERERACDEYVLASGNDAEQYAQGILTVCRCCLASPPACVSGVTGSDLKKRIVRIIHGGFAKELTPSKRAFLVGVSVIAIAAPVMLGLLHSQLQPVAAAVEQLPSFEVVSIRPHDPNDRGGSVGGEFPRYYIRGQSTEMVLVNAFEVQMNRILGMPSWVKSDRYDIEAKMDDSFASLPPEQQYKTRPY